MLFWRENLTIDLCVTVYHSRSSSSWLFSFLISSIPLTQKNVRVCTCVWIICVSELRKKLNLIKQQQSVMFSHSK